MAATRWHITPEEITRWTNEEEDEFMGDWILDFLKFQTESSQQMPSLPDDSPSDEAVLVENPQIPAELPILPLRGLVVYPLTAVPLTIGQPRSIRLVDDVANSERLIGLIAARDPEKEAPNPEDLYQTGTIAMIHRLFRAPDGTIRLVVQGLSRFRVVEYLQTEPYLKARIEPAPEIEEEGIEMEALARNVRDQFIHITELIPSIPREFVNSIASIEGSLQTTYSIANFQRMDLQDAQDILEFDSTRDKLLKLVSILTREIEMLELGQKIQNEARSEIEKVQREYFLREQLKAIQKELGERDEQAADVEDFRQKIEKADMPEEAAKQSQRELDRLSRLPTSSAEYGVIRTYLDWLVSLPWNTHTSDNLDITHAREVLDHDHYGLEDIKARILEFLAVRKLRLDRREELSQDLRDDQIRREREGVILCFVGPPGVGKTSLGQSIARALGRKFIRISLGGIRDEAEIRGHRRTYIGSLPGRILQALRRAESNNPVFMLDEIDKMSADFRGDPASALLEVLDPEQNSEFRDHYLEVAFNLSQVMFITTANTLETIPAPLLDRMEIIQLAGYTEGEKVKIANQYLVPRQLRENGLRPGEVVFTEAAIHTIIRQYTREAGVRNLERELGSVCRKVVAQLAEDKLDVYEIDADQVRKYLGRPHFQGDEEISMRTSEPGVATGLAWTPVGGDILFIEATRMPGAKGFQTTGSIGKVMEESAKAALSYVRSRAEVLGLPADFFDHSDIHLHIPAGAQPKDGPSAGVTIATAIVSLISGKPVRSDVGMTGEITLRGQVLPVGGIKEKVLAAHRYGLKTIILPKKNQEDLEELSEEVRTALKFIFAETVTDVIQNALEEPSKPASKSAKRGRQTKHE